MAAEGMQFSCRWKGGTISANLELIWEKPDNREKPTMNRMLDSKSASGGNVSRRRFMQGTAGVALAAAAGSYLPRRAHAARELNALVWCDHTDPALIEPFERKFDVKVNLKEYEGTGTALAIIEQSQPGDWDVFVIDGVDVPRVIEAGLLAELPQDQLPLDDVFAAVQMRDVTFSGGKMYAIMEKFGYNVISYNKAKVDPADMRDLSVLWSD